MKPDFMLRVLKDNLHTRAQKQAQPKRKDIKLISSAAQFGNQHFLGIATRHP